MKIKNPFSSLKTALWICAAAFLLAVVIYPEIFLQRGISFADWDDYLIDYQSTFMITGFFYQGGIQLWDYFGQVPHAFLWVTHGMFRLPNLLTSAAYILLSPFTDNSAQFFDRVFSIVYIGSLMGIRVMGIFLLLKRLTEDKWILRVCPVIFAIFFSPGFMFGTYYQSFFPLLMYFILSFFLTGRPLYLGLTALFMIFLFSQGSIPTCYMYLGVNMFIVSCVLYSLWDKASFTRRCQEFCVKNAQAIKRGFFWVLAAAVVILGPYFYMQLFCLKDIIYDVDHSRLTGMWSAGHYFHHLLLDTTPAVDFFRWLLDFTFLPGRSFFLGFMIFFLSGVALTLSRDRRKWIFILTIFLVWSINFPRDVFSIGLIGHWINVLTNPLKSMVRSYQVACNAIVVFLLMPLGVMGWEVLKDLGKGQELKTWRIVGFVIFLVIFSMNGFGGQPSVVKIYFTLSMVMALTGMVLLMFSNKGTSVRRIAIMGLVLLLITDVGLSAWQMKKYLASCCRLRPHTVGFLPAQLGPVGLDYHNPKIFPFVSQWDMYPIQDSQWPFLWSVRDISLNFDRVMNRESAFLPVESHNPRPIACANWAQDPLMREYALQNSRLFYFAGYGVKQGPEIFDSIVNRRLTQDVMMVEGNEPSLQSDIPPSLERFSGQDQWASIVENIRDISPGWVYDKNMAIWEFPLPVNLPDYFASSIFMHDRWVRFYLETADQKYVELTPVQGQLLRPMTFDVQNIKEGKVFVALPVDTSFEGLKGALLLKVKDASGITAVWRHTSDQTGINFQAPRDGWLGIQYPYDPKWRIEVDGREVHFYRANKSFIGLPITQGEHKILISYWPNSWLRWGLPLSFVVASILFIVLIIVAFYTHE